MTRTIPAIAILMAIGLAACTKLDPLTDPGSERDGQDTEASAGNGWTVSISATMGGDSPTKALAEDPDTHKLLATFETTDAIYVYNKTKNRQDATVLHPDQSGATAVISGTLTGEYAAGDEIVLCYNLDADHRFHYLEQKGTLATVADFAKAEKTITTAEATDKALSGTVSFDNLQSVFRFSFTDGSSAVPVQSVSISTAGGKLVQTDLRYKPDWNSMYYGAVTVVPNATTSDPIIAALRNENDSDDTFFFEVDNGSGVMYKGTKAAPAGKIVNGKFYVSTVTLTQVPKPMVILTDNGSAVEPNAGNYGYLDAGNLTVSGTGEGYYFSWGEQSFKSLTLTGASITCYGREPVSSSRSILNPIIIEGDNYIITDADHAAVAYKSYFSNSDLSQSIKGNGTLTITASSTVGTKGFKNTYSSPVNVVAASGYILTISDGTDNGDGTTTWVYTVAPEVTVEMVDLGLPSGTLWAKYNLGVADPTVDPYGNYYAWGEATPKKGAHTFGTYQLGNGTDNYSCLTKYIIADDHTYAAGIDGKTQLEPADDAATAALGSGYCIPTAEDWMELWNGQYVTFSWSYITCVNPELPELYPNVNTKVYGILVRSKSNGNSIFLPAAGVWKSGTSVPSRGGTDNTCYYWSSTLYAFTNSYPVSFEAYCFNEDHMFSYYEPAVNGSNPLTLNSMPHDARCYGMPVRPVKHP